MDQIFEMGVDIKNKQNLTKIEGATIKGVSRNSEWWGGQNELGVQFRIGGPIPQLAQERSKQIQKQKKGLHGSKG